MYILKAYKTPLEVKFGGRRRVLIEGDCMNIVSKKIEDLKPYKNNPRKHPEKSVEFVANSIKEFGFKVPILIDKNDEIKMKEVVS